MLAPISNYAGPPAVEAILKREKIYLAHEWLVEGVFASGETVRIPGAWRPERFASMPRRGFANFGAFTYCQSPGLILSLEAGRYRLRRDPEFRPRKRFGRGVAQGELG